MPKIKITNLKAGACVINSLNVIIPGMTCIIKDSSDIEDPDIMELEHLGIISIQKVETKTQVVKKTTQVNNDSSKSSVEKNNVTTAESEVSPKTACKNGTKKTKNKKSPSIKKKTVTQAKRKGTDFRDIDNFTDDMGAKVVIMGENGPEEKHMNPGINGGNGPKYVGDDLGEPADESDFISI